MDLKEYLRRVYELEKSCYEQRRLIGEVSGSLRSAQNPRYKAHSGDEDAQPFSKNIGYYIFLLLYIEGGTFIFAAFTGAGLAGVVQHALRVFSIGLVLWLIAVLISEANRKKRRSALSQENQGIDSYNQTLQRRSATRAEALSRQLTTLKNAFSDTQQTLQRFYGLNAIYPKYRNFVAISMFYEYLCSGRCSALEGHEGAYNIYEQEIRMNLILSKLDEVIAHLDRIEDNQYMLASAIREGNAKADQIYRTLQNVESSTAASAYFSEVSAMNTTYMAWFRKNL